MANIRVLATDLEFPEGPVVLPDGSVVLVEIRGQRLTRISRSGRSLRSCAPRARVRGTLSRSSRRPART